MVNSPVYQIDFTVVASGKHIAATKRRIRWRWGFANQDALAAGLSSTACRGEEHDVTVVWSIVSGKCNVLADGQEVHVSNSRSGSVSCSWTMKGNHVLQVIAHAMAPQAPMRQYELLVDGQSFFEMPKVFHLGLQLQPGGPHAVSPHDKLPVAVSNRFESPYNNYSVTAPPPPPQHYSARNKNIVELEAPRNLHEEEVFLAEAIKNSLREQQNSTKVGPPAISPTVSKNEDLILNFFDDPVPTTTYVPAPPPTSSSSSSDGLLFHENSTMPATVSPVPMQLFASPQPMVPPPALAIAPIMQPSTYAPPPPPPPNMGAFSYKPPVMEQPTVMSFQPIAPPVSVPMTSAPPVPAQTAPFSFSMTTNEPPKGLGKDANQAFEKFANMDLLGSSSKRANPFDNPSNGPSLSSLAELNAGKTNSNPIVASSSSFEKKPIMKSSLSPPNNTSMVLSGNQQGNWGGYAGGATPMMNSTPAPILGHGYSQSGYAGYSMYGAPQQLQQQQQQQQQQFQTPTTSGPFYSGPGYSAAPQQPPPRANPW